MRPLIAVTCIAILAAIGWLGWREYAAAGKRADQAAYQACLDDKRGMEGADSAAGKRAVQSLCQMLWSMYR